MCRNSDETREYTGSKNGLRPRLMLSMGALGVTLCALILYGCSASASRGETQAAPQAATVSPEQCLNGGVIQTANDQQNYHIQPGDQLAISFYLNPESNDEVPGSPDAG